MVKLAAGALDMGVDPDAFIPQNLKGAHPSLAQKLKEEFDTQGKMLPFCPHLKAQFVWTDYVKRKQRRITAHRYLLPCLVTKYDVFRSWKTGNTLQVWMKWPDVMNFPVQQAALIMVPDKADKGKKSPSLMINTCYSKVSRKTSKPSAKKMGMSSQNTSSNMRKRILLHYRHT